MLVLTRKVGEQVLIGDDVVVTVLEVRGDGIKIGIDAPRSVKVQRREIVLSVADTNVEAARSADSTTESALKALFGVSALQQPDTEDRSSDEGTTDEANGPQAGKS
ncbi:carbon storage regulator CsrA [Nesterenkonia massiliensis]|uniref:carbon storage regulator CsrA n=1 Tax=Nesterenkonia massiliensis TaxID=1232429 RepID=UPI0021A5A4AA|nr:carbon storage regulator CsrA [Nesterenkonia massiliensis]